jgi:hypothetical protein
LGSLFAKPIFSVPADFLFRLVKDALVVSLLCAQQVEHDASKFVGRGSSRLGFAEPPRDAPEELTQIVFGVMQGLSAHAESSRNPASDTSALVKSTFPPLIFFSRQSPSHDAKAEAFRNRETSVPISHKMV